MLLQEGNALVRRFDEEILRIEPWGENGLRVRASRQATVLPNEDFALLPRASQNTAAISISGTRAQIKNGKLRCEVLPSGKLRFYNQNDELLLEEYDRSRFRAEDEGFNSALEIVPRTFSPILGTDNYKLCVRFESAEEKLYGMGQYQQPNLDIKGSIIELAHRNSQASVPFLLSSLGYGFLWNNPAIGKAIFGNNLTEWHAESTKQMDYWITAGDSPAEIVEAYADVAGKAPMMPDYGTGFWQCKLRYQTQEELLGIAREYKRRQLPISVIVIDFFHWPHQGDWCFDPEYWPDPAAMVKELRDMGIELMVSVWPTVQEESVNYAEMRELGYLTRAENGKRMNQLGRTAFVDMTNPGARAYVWGKLKENYYKYGIKIFWLDEAEPEFSLYQYDQYRYQRGADLEIGNMYPRDYARMAYEGMEAEGQQNIINLARCAWAGSQRYGALVWSGDIDSSFRSLRSQFAAGLNMGIAGIPWWTTDIGGFHGGNITDPHFIECFVRWFQFGAFSPVFRLHGDRDPHNKPLGTTGGGMMGSGASNEVWTYGEEAYEVCKKYMLLREKLRPYVSATMQQAHQKGSPAMRTLFYNFPNDAAAWDIADQFCLGDDILVAPIFFEGKRERTVYLPAGCNWRDLNTGIVHPGGQSIQCTAPLDTMPVFIRDGKLTEITLG